LRQRDFRARIVKQNLGAEQAELPLEEKIVAVNREREATFRGGFGSGKFSGLQIGARNGKQLRQVLGRSGTGGEQQKERGNQAAQARAGGHLHRITSTVSRSEEIAP
jgi:hypothetical protein